jgi:hypothetical protein
MLGRPTSCWLMAGRWHGSVTSKSWSCELDGVFLPSRTVARTWAGVFRTPLSQAQRSPASATVAVTISRPGKKSAAGHQAHQGFGHSTSAPLTVAYGFARGRDRLGRCESGTTFRRCAVVVRCRTLGSWSSIPAPQSACRPLAGVALSPDEPRRCSKAAVTTRGCDIEGGGHYFETKSELLLLCIWPGRESPAATTGN